MGLCDTHVWCRFLRNFETIPIELSNLCPPFLERCCRTAVSHENIPVGSLQAAVGATQFNQDLIGAYVFEIESLDAVIVTRLNKDLISDTTDAS